MIFLKNPYLKKKVFFFFFFFWGGGGGGGGGVAGEGARVIDFFY